MKKIIFVLVILAVLLFSGCDAMLEVFYPEFADEYSGNNIFDVDYALSDFHYGVLVGSGQPLMISLYYSGDDPMTGDTALETVHFYDRAGLWTFFPDDQSYDVWIWCDVNNNDIVDTGDFRTTTPVNIDFIGTDGYGYEYKDQFSFQSVI